MTVNDIHINDLVNDTKSEKVLKYTGGVIEKNFDGIYTYPEDNSFIDLFCNFNSSLSPKSS